MSTRSTLLAAALLAALPACAATEAATIDATVIPPATIPVTPAGCEERAPEADAPGAASAPKPGFQADYFGEMPRAFGFVTKVDTARSELGVKLDKGTAVTVPIRLDTELRFRNSWGDLGEYFPGQRVMLFMNIDDEKRWTYPRAVQDEIQMTTSHKWWAAVTKLDVTGRRYSTARQEQGKTISADYLIAPDLVVRKGKTTGGIELLAVGDVVLQQQVEREGVRLAVEIFDEAGGQAIAAEQDARHRAAEDKLGLPVIVNDVDVTAGGLTASVPWSSATRARALKPGDVVVMQASDGDAAFAGAVSSNAGAGTQRRLLLVVNGRAAARLAIGARLHLFMPGTGPALPTGRTGLPPPPKT
jgi:hypothetical protein